MVQKNKIFILVIYNLLLLVGDINNTNKYNINILFQPLNTQRFKASSLMQLLCEMGTLYSYLVVTMAMSMQTSLPLWCLQLLPIEMESSMSLSKFVAGKQCLLSCNVYHSINCKKLSFFDLIKCSSSSFSRYRYTIMYCKVALKCCQMTEIQTYLMYVCCFLRVSLM